MEDSTEFIVLLVASLVTSFIVLYLLSRMAERCERDFEQEEKIEDLRRKSLVEKSLVTKIIGPTSVLEEKIISEVMVKTELISESSQSCCSEEKEQRPDESILREDIENQATCSICLNDYECGQEISSPKNGKCQHTFHKECIVGWLLKHDDCPCCRRQYLDLESTRSSELSKVQPSIENERNADEEENDIIVSMEEGVTQS